MGESLMTAEVPVLIVGAGPTGLVLALWLTRAGVPVRIVDAAAGPGTTSRALVMHARSLELYRQLGIADRAIAEGLTFAAANLWVKGRRVARAPLGDLGEGLSPYPYVLVIGQDAQERLLVAELDALGVRVERSTEVIALEVESAGATATLRRADRSEQRCTARWIAGCDGARSAVRKAIGVGFPGGTYSHVFYVADVVAEGAVANGELHLTLDEADFLAVFPMRGGGARFIGQVRAPSDDAVPTAWADVDAEAMRQLGVRVTEVRWFSTYRVHHRVAEAFRRGPVFLLGDAAHIHSPVGGQGMNTGIGDAVNLAWKLAAVVQGRADETILDSYAAERMPFARSLVATTDRAFALVTSTGRLARVVRTRLVPRVLPLLLRLRAFRRLMFRTISQTAIRYPDSPLSAGRAGRVRGGDRLPWVADAGDGADNGAPLQTRAWQLHVYGRCSQELRALCHARGLALYAVAWRGAMRRAGLAENAAYLVRPDGHVALASAAADPAAVAAYLDLHGLRPGAGS